MDHISQYEIENFKTNNTKNNIQNYKYLIISIIIIIIICLIIILIKKRKK